MVVKRRLLLAVASALTLMLTAAAPMLGATRESQPSPLRAANVVRARDIAANGNTNKGAIVAVGYYEGSGPGQLYLAFSTNGGRDFRRSNGNLRRYPIVGEPKLGLSLAICAGRVWAASGYHAASDKAGDSDVFLTTRSIGGGAAQALMTSTADDRRVRSVSIACVGNEYVAVGWVQKSGTKRTARLMLRSMDPLGTAPAFKRIYNLGAAQLKAGLDVAATPSSVAVTFVRDGDLRLKRFTITDDAAPAAITQQPLQTIAWNDVRYPVIAARGQRLAVAYSDAGKVRIKTSRDQGQSLSGPRTLVNTGGQKNPSKPWSIDVVGDRMVVTTGVYSKSSGQVTPARMTSSNFGESWSKRNFGNRGTRMAALLKRKQQDPLLREAWDDNAPRGSADTLRARYELP